MRLMRSRLIWPPPWRRGGELQHQRLAPRTVCELISKLCQLLRRVQRSKSMKWQSVSRQVCSRYSANCPGADAENKYLGSIFVVDPKKFETKFAGHYGDDKREFEHDICDRVCMQMYRGRLSGCAWYFYRCLPLASRWLRSHAVRTVTRPSPMVAGAWL